MARSLNHPTARLMALTLALAAIALQVPVASARTATAPNGVVGSPETLSVPDITAPTTPTNFRVVSRAKSGLLTLGWDASSDAVGVAGYMLYRNGRWLGTLYQAGVDLLGTVMYDRLEGKIKTSVTYDLYAFDAAGNRSVPATLVVMP